VEKEEENNKSQTDTDLRPSEELRVLMGGRKLSVDILLRILIEKGHIVVCQIIQVDVHGLGDSTFDVTMEEGQSLVHHLKWSIQEQVGAPVFKQHLCYRKAAKRKST
jgi:hypothetical protein